MTKLELVDFLGDLLNYNCKEKNYASVLSLANDISTLVTYSDLAMLNKVAIKYDEVLA